jgi:hypothetical protein
MNAIRYWDVIIKRSGDRHPDDGVLNYYLARSNVDIYVFDKPPTLAECIHQLNNARDKFKDTLKDVKDHSSQYEHEVDVARVEQQHPCLLE